MTNTERIQANNAELRECIQMAENLPDVGTGGTPTPTQEKTINIVENGTVEVVPDEGYALSKVTANVNVPIPDGYIQPSGELEVTENGTHDVTAYASVNVNVEASGSEDTRFKDYFEGTMTEIDDDTITQLKAFAFRSAITLTSAHLPNVKSVGQSTFRECNALKTVDLPNLTGLTGTYFCSGCEILTQVIIPKVSGLSNYSFQNCSKLARLEVGNIGSIGTGCFASDDELETLIIRKTGSNIATLSNVNAFNSTKIQNGTGYVYVPKALVDAFKSATNWATYAAQIRAIEDYPEICG